MSKFIFLYFSLFSSVCLSFDVRPVGLKQAIQESSLSFVGSIRGLEITGEKVGRVEAVAKVRVRSCIVGPCTEGELISVKYLVDSSYGLELPVNIPIGAEVVFVFDKDEFAKELTFSVGASGGDRAYSCSAFPYSIIKFDEQFRCSDEVLRGKVFYSTYQEILGWGNNRDKK
jgi:hypothetical protein